MYFSYIMRVEGVCVMKKLIALVLAMFTIFAFAGCGESRKVVIKDKVTEICVGTCSQNTTNRKLSNQDKDTVVELFEKVINDENGKNSDEIMDKLVDGGYSLEFYQNEKLIDNMGINGQYFIYKNKYYKIPDEVNYELSEIVEKAFDSLSNN